MAAEKLGWILIHSRAQYPYGSYTTPQDELKGEYEPGMEWHWKLARPLKEGGPYTLLFAWEGQVFGEATAAVTHAVESAEYNFAFKLNDYTERESVTLADLPVPRSYRSLIRLDQAILQAYRGLIGS